MYMYMYEDRYVCIYAYIYIYSHLSVLADALCHLKPRPGDLAQLLLVDHQRRGTNLKMRRTKELNAPKGYPVRLTLTLDLCNSEGAERP